MTTRRRRKCWHCGQLFRPDPRNLRHQRYCSAKECRRASKAASQRRWLFKHWPEIFNHDATVRRARRPYLAGANPARQLSLQPVAVGAAEGGNDLG